MFLSFPGRGHGAQCHTQIQKEVCDNTSVQAHLRSSLPISTNQNVYETASASALFISI
jgi:hypothetical protein